jgi:WD40 repeat protein
VYCLAFSPNGKVLASCGGDNLIQLWDIGKRKPIGTLRGHSDDIASVVFSSDGKMLASGSHLGGEVIVWDVGRRQVIHKFSMAKSLFGTSVSFSPDNKLLAASCDGGAIIWCLPTAKRVALVNGHKNLVALVRFSPDGKRLATVGGGSEGVIFLWDVPTWKKRTTLKAHQDGVHCVVFTSDSKFLVSGGSAKRRPETGELKLWDLATGKAKLLYRGTKPAIVSWSIALHGERLATGGLDGEATLWGLDTGKKLRTFQHGEGNVRAIAISPDGKFLVTGTECGHNPGVISIWDIAPTVRR